VFEDAVSVLARDEASIPHQLLNRVKIDLKFTRSRFAQFLLNYLQSMREKLWNPSEVDSSGIFPVTKVLTATIR